MTSDSRDNGEDLAKGQTLSFRPFLNLAAGYRFKLKEAGYISRKRRIRRRTFEYMAGVTRPVCVFCWLG